jgi:hypothetical protein
VPYNSFIDYKTGDYYSNEAHPDTHLYWKPLIVVLKRYMNHKELKMDGETQLHRRHITIEEKDLRYIGKESNDLEEYLKLGVSK